MRASDLGYTLDDVMAGIEHFPFAKTLDSHKRFFTTTIAKHVQTVNTSKDEAAIKTAKYHIHRMTNHYSQLVNEFADAWIDLKANWNEEELFSVTQHPKTFYYVLPKGTGFKNCDTDMKNQRIEFYYLGKLITPQKLSDKLTTLHIRSNPFALTNCIIHDHDELPLAVN